MRQLLITIYILCITSYTSIDAQVKIGDNPGNINNSSLLELESTDKGILISRLTSSQKNAIASPSQGLLIFQTDSVSGFYYYNGTTWEILLSDTTKTYTDNVSLDVIGKGVGSSKTTTVRVNNVIGEQFAIGNEIFFDLSKPDNYAGGDIIIDLDFFPMASESGKTVRWELSYKIITDNSVASGTTGTLYSGDLPLSSVQYTIQDAVFTIPASDLIDAEAIHFTVKRLSSTSGVDPSTQPTVIHCTAIYSSYR